MSHEFDPSGRLIPPTREQLIEIDEELDIIVFDQGQMEDGTPYWAYIAIKPSRYSDFMRATQQRNVLMLEDYGEIIHYGFDAELPESAVAFMRQEYGFDDHYVEKLGGRLIDAQTAFMRQREANRISDIVAMLKKNQPS